MNKNGKILSLNGVAVEAREALYNLRKKYILDEATGEMKLVSAMAVDGFIFNPDGVETSEYTKSVEWKLEELRAMREFYLGEIPFEPQYHSEYDPTVNIARSKRRAVNQLNDYILANNFDCFVTLTLDGEKIDRNDYNGVMKKLKDYLGNRTRRNGLRYVGVPELHKKGGLHFHFLCNSSALKLVDSGTVSVPDIYVGRKKPIKVATADRKGVPLEERHTVYNVDDWSLGFSTAILTYGDVRAVANYVGKYITKGEKKIGGRWYYSGGELKKPICVYERVDFNAVDNFTYDYKICGKGFKVAVYDSNGEMVMKKP